MLVSRKAYNKLMEEADRAMERMRRAEDILYTLYHNPHYIKNEAIRKQLQEYIDDQK